jgi:hypothetical protein
MDVDMTEGPAPRLPFDLAVTTAITEIYSILLSTRISVQELALEEDISKRIEAAERFKAETDGNMKRLRDSIDQLFAIFGAKI